MLYWLSFADPKRPEGEQFLGAVILHAVDIGDAIEWAWELGLNPGGEVRGVPLPLAPATLAFLQAYCSRLLTYTEATMLAARLEHGTLEELGNGN